MLFATSPTNACGAKITKTLVQVTSLPRLKERIQNTFIGLHYKFLIYTLVTHIGYNIFEYFFSQKKDCIVLLTFKQ